MNSKTASDLSAKEKTRLSAELLSQQSELTERLNAIRVDVARRLNADSAEQAIELENAEVLEILKHEAEAELGEVEGALTRLAAGKYGVCIECGEPIRRERLLAYPRASLCMACKSAEESATAELR